MRKILLTLAVVAGLVATVAPAQAAPAASGSSCYYSPRGCVYVSGYYRPSTGTYVRPYVRSYPGYGSYHPRYSYRPSYRPSYGYSYSYRPSYSYGSGYGF